ncbi:uncharacterized protein N7498_010279 [Penicillium cinerascens]|uniref:Uncharacterized protein n=1 Tax=Penicillium cinerascens TaxID=70096 RepID=A0A9W9J672_9EURO|nr:uncharacterized protein N7498_010279 [Penicillium cinerascens]KAJ5191294.1 hypothetical protein N7498_010279 [Penicillium cinerascens]
MSDIHLDNSGAGPLQVPGFGDVPLDYELKIGQSFAHGALPNFPYLEGRATRLTLPEVFMLRLMERVTEIPNWEEDIFDNDVVAQWHADLLSDSKFSGQWDPAYCDEGVDMDLVSLTTWNWCVAELRDKAMDFVVRRYILTLNSDSGVCKSDVFVGKSLHHEFL